MLGKLQFGIDPWTQTTELSVKMEEMALEMFQKGTWIWPKELTTAEPCPASPIPNVFYRFMFAHPFFHGSSVSLPAEGTVLKMTLAVRMPAFQSRADPWLWEAEITQFKSWAAQWALGSSLQLYRMVWYLVYRLETMGCFNLWNIYDWSHLVNK